MQQNISRSKILINVVPKLYANKKEFVGFKKGIVLYYGIALDLTMLVSLGALVIKQSQHTDTLWEEITWFLNYAAIHPNVTICYSKSDTVLHITSDGSFCSENCSRSKVRGMFYLSSNPQI